MLPSIRRLTPVPPSPPAVSGAASAPVPAAAPEPQDKFLRSLGAQALPPPPVDSEDNMAPLAHTLHRPLILVHGMGQKGDTWFNFKNYFITNPDNKFGGVYSRADENDFLRRLRDHPNGKSMVFAIDFTDNIGSPVPDATELKRLVDLVTMITGSPEVDVVTHSMGGIVAREYLRDGGGHIRNLIMLAPPNHGSAEADLAIQGSNRSLFHHYPEDDNGSLVALQSETGLLGGERNPYLGQLDRAWENDSRRVRTTIITGMGVPTPAYGWRPLQSGDGMVTPRSAKLDHADFYLARPHDILPGAPGFRDFESMRFNHLHIVSESTVMHKVDEVLAADSGEPALPPAPEPQQEWLFPEMAPTPVAHQKWLFPGMKRR